MNLQHVIFGVLKIILGNTKYLHKVYDTSISFAPRASMDFPSYFPLKYFMTVNEKIEQQCI